MKVHINTGVHQQIHDFYKIAMIKHISLDEITVARKIDRLYKALDSLGLYANSYPLARLKQDWISKGYKEYIYEDFHFAYQVYICDDGSEIVNIHDVCHSYLYKE